MSLLTHASVANLITRLLAGAFSYWQPGRFAGCISLRKACLYNYNGDHNIKPCLTYGCMKNWSNYLHHRPGENTIL